MQVPLDAAGQEGVDLADSVPQDLERAEEAAPGVDADTDQGANDVKDASWEALVEAAEALGLDGEPADGEGEASPGPDGDDPVEAPHEAGLDTGAGDSEALASDSAAEPEAGPEAVEPEPEVPDLSEEEAGMLGKVLFALLFASPEPLSMGRLKDLTESPTKHVRAGLDTLEQQIEGSELPLILRSIAGGFRLFSAPEVSDVVARLSKVRKAEQISPAALETLAIVAYRQPTTKAEVEAIRGVQAGPMLRGLIDRGLVRVTGRADQPGSPLQYGTTREFLDRFGLETLKALPRDNELAGK
jgi:segregation and condensation protein B